MCELYNNDAVLYIPPFGEELQNEVFEDGSVSLHSDTYLLSRLSDMSLSENMIAHLSERLQPVVSSLPEDLQTAASKLSDFDLMQTTPSRYTQFLSDKVSEAKEFFSKLDKHSETLKSDEERAKFDKARTSLRDFILRFSSDDDNKETN